MKGREGERERGTGIVFGGDGGRRKRNEGNDKSCDREEREKKEEKVTRREGVGRNVGDI